MSVEMQSSIETTHNIPEFYFSESQFEEEYEFGKCSSQPSPERTDEESEQEIDFGSSPTEKYSNSLRTESEEIDYSAARLSSLALTKKCDTEKIKNENGSEEYFFSTAKSKESEEADSGGHVTQDSQPFFTCREYDRFEFLIPSQKCLSLTKMTTKSGDLNYVENPNQTYSSSEVPSDFVDIDIDFSPLTPFSCDASRGYLTDNSRISEVRLERETSSSNFNLPTTVSKKKNYTNEKSLEVRTNLSEDEESEVSLDCSMSENTLDISVISGTVCSYRHRLQQKIDNLVHTYYKNPKFDQSFTENLDVPSQLEHRAPQPCPKLSHLRATHVNKKFKKEMSSRILNYPENEVKLDKSLIQGTISSYPEKIKKKMKRFVDTCNKQHKFSDCSTQNSDRVEKFPMELERQHSYLDLSLSAAAPTNTKFNEEKSFLSPELAVSEDKGSQIVSYCSKEGDKLDNSLVPGTISSYPKKIENKIKNFVNIYEKESKFDQLSSGSYSETPPALLERQNSYLNLSLSDAAPANKKLDEEQSFKTGFSQLGEKSSKIILHYSESQSKLDDSVIPGTESSYPDRLQKKFDKLMNVYQQTKLNEYSTENSSITEIPPTPDVQRRSYSNFVKTVVENVKMNEEKIFESEQPTLTADRASRIILHYTESEDTSVIPGTTDSYPVKLRTKIDKLVDAYKQSNFDATRNSSISEIPPTPDVQQKLHSNFIKTAPENEKMSEEKRLKFSEPTLSSEIPIVLHYSESEEKLSESLIPGTISSYPVRLEKKIQNFVNLYNSTKK